MSDTRRADLQAELATTVAVGVKGHGGGCVVHGAKHGGRRRDRRILVLVALIVAGCIQPSQGTSAARGLADVVGPVEPPAILFGESLQGHAIVVLGVECCNLTWGSLSIQSGGDTGCDVHAPSSGPILVGESIQALLPALDSQCSYAIAYDGTGLGNFLFAPDMPVEASAVTATATVTQAPASNDTQPQGGNGTVPP